MRKNELKICKIKFFIPIIILSLFISLSILKEEKFLLIINLANNHILNNLGWLVNILALIVTVVAISTIFTKFGNIRIGGKNAIPEYSNLSWFFIAFTTTMAIGIFSWGPAEPIAHIINPATNITGIVPFSKESFKFSMETMFLHWTIVPYCIYTVPAVVFAFMHYNAESQFSISSEILPILGKYSKNNIIIKVIDILTLFSITSGMAGSASLVIMNIGGGISKIFGIDSNPKLWLSISICIGLSIAVISIFEVKKGLKYISSINILGYMLFLLFLLLFSKPSFIFGLATESLGGFIGNFFEKMLVTGTSAESEWSKWWTTFYWFSWMSWGPTAGAFIGKAAYGRKIKHILGIYILICGTLSFIWISIVSGTSLWIQKNKIVDLIESYNIGFEHVPYDMLNGLPLARIITPFFIILIFMTVVVSCYSNIVIMSCISIDNKSIKNIETPSYLKIIWGIATLCIGYIMISLLGVKGVKIITNLGGIFAIFIISGSVGSLMLLIINHEKYDKTIKDK